MTKPTETLKAREGGSVTIEKLEQPKAKPTTETQPAKVKEQGDVKKA